MLAKVLLSDFFLPFSQVMINYFSFFRFQYNLLVGHLWEEVEIGVEQYFRASIGGGCYIQAWLSLKVIGDLDGN